ncbi:hypothetical protein EGM85_12240, partial [Macrococcus caseolyticus]
SIFPELRWAQRSSATEPEKNKLWITVAVPNLQDYSVETTDSTFKFTGKDAEREYAIELELFAEIDSSLTRKAATAQSVVVELRKKEAKVEYWPRLAKDTKRRPFIRTDFDKWVDEDEQNEVPDEDPMAGMGGFGSGAPGGGDFDMSQLNALQAALGQGGAGGGMPPMDFGSEADAGSDEEDGDSSVAELGKAQD